MVHSICIQCINLRYIKKLILNIKKIHYEEKTSNREHTLEKPVSAIENLRLKIESLQSRTIVSDTLLNLAFTLFLEFISFPVIFPCWLGYCITWIETV